jgi:hypothetical protein
LVGELEVSCNLQIESMYHTNQDDADNEPENDDDDDDDERSIAKSIKKADEPPPPSNKLVLLLLEPQADFYPGGSWGTYEGLGASEAAERIADFTKDHIG